MNSSSVFDKVVINATAVSNLGILAKQSCVCPVSHKFDIYKIKRSRLSQITCLPVSLHQLVIKIPNVNEKLLTVLYDSNRDRRTFGSSSKIPVHYVTYQNRR